MASVLPSLARGLLIGILIAAPVGPMALLCIRRTVERGWASGLASGLGIATADGIYGGAAAFGLTAVSGLLLRESRWVQVAGGIAIAMLGLRSLLAAPAPGAAAAPAQVGLAADYASCLGLTLANPPTILSLLAVMAGFGVGAATGGRAAWTVAGVLLGSAAWWAALTGKVARVRGRLGVRPRAWIPRAAALLPVSYTHLPLATNARVGHPVCRRCFTKNTRPS